MKVSLSIVILAVATLGFSSADDEESYFIETDPHSIKDDVIEQGAAESRQLSAVADSSADLEPAATGYGHNFHNGYGNNLHGSTGYNGNQGYNGLNSYHGDHHGKHGISNNLGYHDKGGKNYLGHGNNQQYHQNHNLGNQGFIGQDLGTKGHHIKGRKNKGFKNVYHKEEYGVNHNDYDDEDLKKYLNNDQSYNAHFGGNNGGFSKGAGYGGNGHHNAYGNKGLYDNGYNYNNLGNKKAAVGNNGYYGHNTLHGLNNGYGNGQSFGLGYGGIGHGLGGYGLGGYGLGGYGLGGYGGLGYGQGY